MVAFCPVQIVVVPEIVIDGGVFKVTVKEFVEEHPPAFVTVTE